MIQLIEGPLGSGKSYFAVNYLYKFVKYDALYDEYVIDPNVLIISNIEGLRCKHWDLTELLKDRKKEDFFTIENFEAIMKKTGKNHIILVIDECHLLFPSGYGDKNIYNFFAYSRHLGLDILLMTQGVLSMSRMFNPLLEFIVKAKPRTKQLFKTLSFQFVDLTGNYLYSKSLPKDKLIFGMYKSFRVDEKNKPKNALVHWIVICSVFFIVSGILFKSALALIANKSKVATTKKANFPVAPVNSGVDPAAVAAAVAAAGVPGAVSPPVVPGSAPGPVPIGAPVPGLLSSVVSAVSPPVSAWRSVVVDGRLSDGKKRYYLINGQRVESWRCKNYDSFNSTVDYYSLEPLPAKGAGSPKPADVRGGDPLRLAGGKVEPLGGTAKPVYEHTEISNGVSDYCPIPVGTEIKTASVTNGKQLHVPVHLVK